MRPNFCTVPFAWLVAAAFMVGSPLAASNTPLSHGTATMEPQAKKPKGKATSIDAHTTKREEILKWLKLYLRDAGEEFESYDSMDKILWTKINGKKFGRYIASLRDFNFVVTSVMQRQTGDQSSDLWIIYPAIVFPKGSWKSLENGNERTGNGITFNFIGSHSDPFAEGEKGFRGGSQKAISKKDEAEFYFRYEWINSSNNPGKRFLAALKDLVDMECSGLAEKSPYE